MPNKMSCQTCGDSFMAGFIIGGIIAVIGVGIVCSDSYAVWDDTGEITIRADKEYYSLKKATDEEILKYIKENK